MQSFQLVSRLLLAAYTIHELTFSFHLFQGEIQQLLISDDAEDAAKYCENYLPDCDSALPYSSLMLDLDKVSTVTNHRSLKIFFDFDPC